MKLNVKKLYESKFQSKSWKWAQSIELLKQLFLVTLFMLRFRKGSFVLVFIEQKKQSPKKAKI